MTIFLALCVFTAGAEAKFAVVSDDDANRPLADLAVAECSGEYDFVERSALQALEAEQRLQTVFAADAAVIKRNALDGADFFAVIRGLDENNRILAVFETDCGIRLETVRLPENDLPAVSVIRETLGRAVEKSAAADKLRFVSLAAVRNNLPETSPPDAAKMTNELKLRAFSLPAVLLEREYLIELLRERRITAKWSRAAAAAEILHFELNPGSDADAVEVAAFFTGRDDKIIFSCRADAADPKALDDMFRQLAAHLSATPSANDPDLKAEAHRFAREAELAAKNGNTFLESTRCYFAAFALDSENMEYWRGVFANAPYDFTSHYPYYKAALEYVLDHPEQLRSNKQLPLFDQTLDRLAHQITRGSPELRRTHRDLLDARRNDLLNLDSGSADRPLSSEISRFRRVRPQIIIDPDLCAAEKLAAWNVLEAKLLAPKPDSVSPEAWHAMLTDSVWTAVRDLYQLQDMMPRRELAGWTESTCEKLTAANISALLPMVPLLRANALFYTKEFTREKYLEFLSEYLTLSGRSTCPSGVLNQSRMQRYPGLEKLAKNLHRTTAADRKTTAAPTNGSTPQPAAASESAEERDLAQFKRQCRLAAAQQRTITSCTAASGTDVFTLSGDGFDFMVKKAGDDKVLASFPYSQFDAPPYNNFLHFRLFADNRYFVAVGSDRLLLCRRDGDGEMLTVPGVPASMLKYAWISGDRLFVLANNSLISMNLDGGDKVIHFAAGREDKALNLHKNSPKMVAGFACPGRGPADVVVLFHSDNQWREILNVNLETGEERTIRRLQIPIAYGDNIQPVGSSLFFINNSSPCLQYLIFEEKFADRPPTAP